VSDRIGMKVSRIARQENKHRSVESGVLTSLSSDGHGGRVHSAVYKAIISV